MQHNGITHTRCFIDGVDTFIKFRFGMNIRFSSRSGGERDKRRHTSWSLYQGALVFVILSGLRKPRDRNAAVK